ncbi:hypothetical protein [uncultured Bradyrhizobium sp.]|uniref:hypothetical protein n=1 Tax=uncultured Bradyrhizobium sp. TaxID=199684 RepID=UPI0035C94446
MPEPSDFLQETACYYFPQIADETGQCVDLPPGLCDWIFTATWDVPQVRDVIAAYRDVLDIDLVRPSGLHSRSNDSVPKQVVRVGLDVILAHFLEKIAGEAVGCLSFSAGGAQAAYIFADIVSTRDYLRSAVSLESENRRILAESGIKFGLSEMLVTGPTAEPAEKFLPDIIETLQLGDRVFLKDRHGANGCLIAGCSRSVERVRAELTTMKSVRMTILNRVTTPQQAHFPLYSRTVLSRMLQDVAFRPPRFAIVDTTGGIVETGSDDFPALRRIYEDSIIGWAASGTAMNQSDKYAKRLMVVSTRFGAGVLDRAGAFRDVAFPEDIAMPLAVLV